MGDHIEFFRRAGWEKPQHYGLLTSELFEMLQAVSPSVAGEMQYYPCQVTMKSGFVLRAVYVQPVEPYHQIWGIYPENDPHKRSVRIEDVVKIEDSPTRLPAKFANELYPQGETGMGRMDFVVRFADGEEWSYVTGNAIDFIQYPEGRGPSDVVSVSIGTADGARGAGVSYVWCLYVEAGLGRDVSATDSSR